LQLAAEPFLYSWGIDDPKETLRRLTAADVLAVALLTNPLNQMSDDGIYPQLEQLSELLGSEAPRQALVEALERVPQRDLPSHAVDMPTHAIVPCMDAGFLLGFTLGFRSGYRLYPSDVRS
jgi:hypothetical protein